MGSNFGFELGLLLYDVLGEYVVIDGCPDIPFIMAGVLLLVLIYDVCHLIGVLLNG